MALWWRKHPEGRPFSTEDAASTTINPLQEAGGRVTSQGYSAFADPWHLFLYLNANRMYDPEATIVAFSGDRIGTGNDGEDLVMPDMGTVRRMSMSDFERELARLPMPPSPKFVPGWWGYNTWADARREYADYELGDDPVVDRIIQRAGSVRTAARFEVGQMASWPSTKPWNLTQAEAEAQTVPGWWGKSARGSESASWEKGYIRPSPEFFAYPEDTRKAIAYHEAGHAMIEAAGGLGAISSKLDVDVMDMVSWPGGDSISYNAEEIIAEVYSVIWNEPSWLSGKDPRFIEVVTKVAKMAGFPLPPNVRTSATRDYWDMSGDVPRWVQPHDELVRDALRNWKGDNSHLSIHIKDVLQGDTSVPMGGNGKIARAQAQALIEEVRNGKPIPKLYRGDNNPPKGFQGWSENRRTANRFAKMHGGKVWVLEPGSMKGLCIADWGTGSGLDQIENEWIVEVSPGVAKVGFMRPGIPVTDWKPAAAGQGSSGVVAKDRGPIIAYRGFGSWGEAKDSLSSGRWRSKGMFTLSNEGETQMSLDLNDVLDSSKMHRLRGTGFLGFIEADISGLPFKTFMSDHRGQVELNGYDPTRATLYPDTGLGIGIEGGIPLDRIHRVVAINDDGSWNEMTVQGLRNYIAMDKLKEREGWQPEVRDKPETHKVVITLNPNGKLYHLANSNQDGAECGAKLGWEAETALVRQGDLMAGGMVKNLWTGVEWRLGNKKPCPKCFSWASGRRAAKVASPDPDQMSKLTEISVRYAPVVAACFDASNDVAAELGLKQVGGYYDTGGGFWGREGHFWNVLSDGTIVDVTHGQFDRSVPVMIATPGSPEAERYVEGGLEGSLANKLHPVAKTAMPSWRGLHEGPVWNDYLAVILVDRGGGGRQTYELYVNGQIVGRAQRLQEARDRIEAKLGPLNWRRIPQPPQKADTFYWGITPEFTDPTAVYVGEPG